MRQWHTIIGWGALLGAPVHGAVIRRAVIAVSVHVQDRCLVHAVGRAASCSGAATYDREVVQGRFAAAPAVAGPRGDATTDYQRVSDASGIAEVAQSAASGATVRATRVTYSF